MQHVEVKTNLKQLKNYFLYDDLYICMCKTKFYRNQEPLNYFEFKNITFDVHMLHVACFCDSGHRFLKIQEHERTSA